jgi:predicted branched-subunit amino acid permease
MKTALDAFVASLIRTYVPWVIGAILGLLTATNVPLDPELEVTLGIVITLAFQGAYYGLTRVFERYVSPKFGWLLGLAQQPTSYRPDPPAGV